MAVTINAPSDWTDHTVLLESGFGQYSVCSIVTKGECLGSVEIAGGESGCVELIAAEDFSYPLAQDEQPQIVLQEPGFVYAPVVQGQDAGYAYICIGDAAVGKVTLTYGETIEQAKVQRRSLWEKLFGGNE